MENTAGTTHLCDKGLTYANICDHAETQYQEVKGVGKWPPATHTLECLLTSPKLTSTPLSNTFRRVSPLPSCATRATALVIFVERKDIGPMNIQTRLALQGSLAQTLPSPTDALWDLQDILDVEIHAGTMDTARRMRRTVSKAKLGKHSSNGHRVNQAC